ncbi:PREDICTED: solute carrier family 40 member 1-like [Brassica oleracea var. oleracea]|uniref:solute carrier family 40 member 1-like n=1 Tax=Brassica oleracea var. oleracea TaxID=109376 RepID=UPI0006A6C943|nr:PREDICTED: solute carrier family 40 member 1-like [Brassica oleracea var. oleracea]
MIYLWPNSLLLAAIYGAIESGSSAIFGPIVGQWIEGLDYVKVLRLWLLCQNLSYIIAGGAVIKLLLDYDLKPRNIPDFATLVALTNVAGAIGVLSTLGGTILIERDWAVVMSEGHPPAVLTRMNSVIRGIDLSSKLLSPVTTGLIISFVSLKASAITFAFWATITAWVEYWLFISVYSGVPAMAQSNERRILRSITKPVEGTDAHVSVSIVPGTEEGNPPRRTGMLKLLDRISTSSFVGAWRIYIKQEVVLPGVSLALLFFTVLRLPLSLYFGFVHMNGSQVDVKFSVASYGVFFTPLKKNKTITQNKNNGTAKNEKLNYFLTLLQRIWRSRREHP